MANEAALTPRFLANIRANHSHLSLHLLLLLFIISHQLRINAGHFHFRLLLEVALPLIDVVVWPGFGDPVVR